jgi:hypothetical protein
MMLSRPRVTEMRTAVDALRSLNRQVALTLGDGWECRLSNQKGDFYRPFARVTQVPTLAVNAETSYRIKLTSAYTVVAYPEKQTTVDDTQYAAFQTMELLALAFAGPGVGYGRVYRIPFYDYDGIPYTGPDSYATEADRDPRDFLKVEGVPDLAINQDQDDDYLWSVTANIRMSWLRSAAVPSTAETIVRVDAEAQPNG